MEPFTVIKHLDVIHDIPPDIISCHFPPVGHTLGFQSAEKPLGHGVIQAVSRPGHAAYYAVALQQSSVFVAGILDATIRVVNKPGLRFPSPHSHEKSLYYQLYRNGPGQGPAHHFAGIEVHDHGEV